MRLLGLDEFEDLLLGLGAHEQMELLLAAARHEARAWIRLLPPDDTADVVQAADPGDRPTLLDLLDETGRKEVVGLLAYAEDDAGGLMNPRYARLRPEMRVDEAISYIRRQTRAQVETVYYLYVLDAHQRVLGVVSFRDLLMAPPERTVRDVMHTDVVTVHEEMDQEAVSALFAEHGFLAVPVVDDDGRMKGIVTVDDIVDVVREEATEDLQKFGGMTALETPYLETPLRDMLRKRGGWLSLLFVGELLTATAMTYFGGSTAGGVKIYRFQILGRLAVAHLVHIVSPNRINPVLYHDRKVEPDVAYSILAFLAVMLFAVIASTFLLSWFGCDFVTALTGSAQAFANVGPGLGDVIGPAGNFSTLPDPAKCVLAMMMILGRLEFFTILVLLTPAFWRP